MVKLSDLSERVRLEDPIPVSVQNPRSPEPISRLVISWNRESFHASATSTPTNAESKSLAIFGVDDSVTGMPIATTGTPVHQPEISILDNEVSR
jgi:hypothetical protein